MLTVQANMHEQKMKHDSLPLALFLVQYVKTESEDIPCYESTCNEIKVVPVNLIAI